jgi:hypothetical protein
MTIEANQANSRTAKRQIHSVLVPLPEPQLTRLLKSVKLLRKDLRLISASASEPVAALKAAQDLLKVWSDELDHILAAKQAKDSHTQVRDWVNEGGASRRAPQLRLIRKLVDDKRPFVFGGADNAAVAGTP